MKKRPQVWRTRFQMPKLLVKSSQCALRLRSVTALRDLAVAISFRLSSEFHCAQWPQVLVSSSVSHVSSSVVENTCVCTRRNDIWLRISSGTPPATLDVTSDCQFERSREHVCMYTSQWHLASLLERNAARSSRCDKNRAERRPLLSMWHAILVSSSTSKFDLLKSNEEATAGPGGVPLKNTLFKVRNQLICSISISSEILRIWIISTLWKLL